MSRTVIHDVIIITATDGFHIFTYAPEFGPVTWAGAVEAAVKAGKSLRHADLIDCDLRGADLRESNLRFANLRWAAIDGANFDAADMRDAWITSPKKKFPGADLRGAILNGRRTT